eukprot:5134265-Prymnesium_polylepis.1
MAAQCWASNGVRCRRCYISRVAPPSSPTAVPIAGGSNGETAGVDPTMPLGVVQSEMCGGAAAYTCYRNGTRQPTTGCLVPWTRCPTGMAQASQVLCATGFDMQHPACAGNCTLMRWAYSCSSQTVAQWTSSSETSLALENAIWAAHVEVTNFNVGGFVQSISQAASDGLRVVGEALAAGGEAIQRAEGR